MRFTLLLASGALAASLALSACSGGSQAIPGGAQSVAPMGHHAAQLVVPGAHHDASCPSSYITCLTLYPGNNTLGICISTSGNCTTGLVGEWNWADTIVTLKGKKYKKFKESWSPNPGNPSTQTIVVKKVKNTHGKVKWVDEINACEVTNPSSCLSGNVGLIGG